MPNENVRAWIYRVLVAVGALAVFYGFITDQELVLYLALAAELLGVTLAAVNTKTS